MLRGELATQGDLLTRVAKILPGWLRRCGVRRSNLADAVQEALVEVLTKEQAGELGASETQTRHELMRIVSNVALRTRRRIRRESERNANIEKVELSIREDEEAWVEARAVVLTALENLDKPTRELIFAHEVEGKTNAEIAHQLNLKEDTIEKRVYNAKQRLRAEIERIECARGRHGDEHGRRSPDRNRGAVALALDFDFSDPCDRALFQSVREASTPPSFFPANLASKVWNLLRPNLATSALAGVLTFAPNSLWTSGPPPVLMMTDVDVPADKPDGARAAAETNVSEENLQAARSAPNTVSTANLVQEPVVVMVPQPAAVIPARYSAPSKDPGLLGSPRKTEAANPVFPRTNRAILPDKPSSKSSEAYCLEDPQGLCDSPAEVRR